MGWLIFKHSSELLSGWVRYRLLIFSQSTSLPQMQNNHSAQAVRHVKLFMLLRYLCIFLLIKEPWPRLVSFRCCLWIAAHHPHFNFLIASINNDWGRKSSRRWLDVTCMSKATSMAHLHSSGALQRRAENHFNDCDVKHSCIKTMSHSAKAAIIGIKTPKLQQVVRGNSVFRVGLAVIHFPPF